MSKPLLGARATLMATVLIAAALAACGGDEQAATTSTSAGGTAVGETVAGDTASEQIRSNVETGPLRVTGGGPEQFRDVSFYSTLKHGKEASRRALEQAARVVHAYLVAHVRNDWSAACSYLDEDGLRSVVNIGESIEGVAGEGCPAIIGRLLERVPAAKAFVSSEMNAGVLRVRREGGYFFYRAGGDPYTIRLSRDDDGNWKLSNFLIVKIEPPPS